MVLSPSSFYRPAPMKTHRHYRIVVREVGLPMSYFKNAKELVYLLARGISGKLPLQ